MKVVRFKPSQKFRVVIDNVSFYTTAKQIRNGVGALGPCNAALFESLESLEKARSFGGIMACTVGHAGTWEGMNVQLDMA